MEQRKKVRSSMGIPAAVAFWNLNANRSAFLHAGPSSCRKRKILDVIENLDVAEKWHHFD